MTDDLIGWWPHPIAGMGRAGGFEETGICKAGIYDTIGKL